MNNPSHILHAYIESRPYLRRIITNTGWLTSGVIFRLCVSLLVGVVVARYLGPRQFGVLSYASSLVAFLGTLSYLGLGGLVIRDLLCQPDERNVILGTTFFLKVAGGVLAYCFLTLTLVFGDVDSTELRVVLLIGLTLLFRPFEVIDFWFDSQTLSRYSVIAKTIGFSITSAAKLLLVIAGASLLAFASVTVLEVILASCLLIVFYGYRTAQGLRFWRFRVSWARELLGQSWMLILSGLFATLYLKIDQVMLRWIVGPAEVGVYSVAATFSEVWYFIPTAIVTSAYPTLLSQKAEDEHQYKASLQKIMDLLYSLSLFIALAITLISPKLIPFLYGVPYEKSGYILMIHIWAGVFVFMRGLLSKWIVIENRIVFSLVTQGLGAFVNVCLNFLLIPPYGGYGAAIATLVSYATASYLALFFHRETRLIAGMMTRSILLPLRLFLGWRPHYSRWDA
jgi:O-antigen/teichoic acid export membrane protein